MKKIFTTLLFIYFILFTAFNSVIALETSTITYHNPDVPWILLTNFKIDKIEKGKIEGSFILENTNDYFTTDLQYEVSLFKGKEFEKLELIDACLSNETFSLPQHQKIQKTFSCQYPQNINDGDYTVIAQLITGRGMPLNSQSQVIQLTGNNNFLTISPESSLVLSGDQAGFQLEGINVNSTDEVYSSFDVKNTGETTITAVPRIKIYQRQYNMPLLKEYDDQPITFKAGETKTIKLLLPKLETPESYLAEIKFYQNNEIVSGINYARWVVKGTSGKIINIIFDKDYFKKGENIEFSAQTVGPASYDTKAGQGKLEVSIISQSGKKIATTTKDISLDELLNTKISIPIKDNLFQPIVNFKLLKNKIILDERTITVPLFSDQGKQYKEQVDKKRNEMLKLRSVLIWFFSISIIIIVPIGLIIFFKKRKKHV